jgi:excinuclease UvrABC nuclease subunit
VLDANWLAGSHVLYIGKAKSSQLRRRLRAYLRFGEGRGGRHWGGRLVWQLPDPWNLLVAWRVEPERNALEVERELISAFRVAHDGRPPFANHPDRRGQ